MTRGRTCWSMILVSCAASSSSSSSSVSSSSFSVKWRVVPGCSGRDVMMRENMQNGMVRLKEGGPGPGLFPVLQPRGDPYAETHPTGDHWLQSMWKEGTAKHIATALSVSSLKMYMPWGTALMVVNLRSLLSNQQQRLESKLQALPAVCSRLTLLHGSSPVGHVQPNRQNRKQARTILNNVSHLPGRDESLDCLLHRQGSSIQPVNNTAAISAGIAWSLVD